MRITNCFSGLRKAKIEAKRLSKITKKTLMVVINGVGTAATYRANTFRKRPATTDLLPTYDLLQI